MAMLPNCYHLSYGFELKNYDGTLALQRKKIVMKQSATSLQEPAHSIFSTTAATGFTDLSTKEKIHRHLTDINDVITEEDIRNIDTSITLQKKSGPISA